MVHVTREEAKAYVGKGWHKILDDFYDVFDRISGATAESTSMQTCEFCGAPGNLNDRYGWLKTTCPAHDKWRDHPPRGV